MFGVLISYLPNLNVGQQNGLVNGVWKNGTVSREEREQERESINHVF